MLSILMTLTGAGMVFFVGHCMGYEKCFRDEVDTTARVKNLFDKINGGIDQEEFERRNELIQSEKPFNDWI